VWAAGAIYEAQRRAIGVPDDIAICGFNDQEVAAEMIPAITTIRVHRYRIGIAASDLILARLEGVSSLARVIDVGFEVVKRQSG
jgi:LacI family gluconate utilization system Gnt-I transcriptional repressor